MLDLRIIYEWVKGPLEDQFSNKNAVLFIGATGSGKSTLINSLLYGNEIIQKNNDDYDNMFELIERLQTIVDTRI